TEGAATWLGPKRPLKQGVAWTNDSAESSTRGLGRFGRTGGRRHLERGVANPLGDRARANALRANANRGVGALGRRDVDTLQVRLELPARNAGDLGADAAQVFCLAADRYLV